MFLEGSQTVDHPEAVYVNSTKQLGLERVPFGSDAPVISPEVNLRKVVKWNADCREEMLWERT